MADCVRYYNKTQFSGLETHITNSYLNPLLQLFKFTPIVRNIALHHAASRCLSENCLLCELGFLFDMLEKAEGQSCQATNFLKAFSSLPEAHRLSVSEDTSSQLQSTLNARVQAAGSFLLEQIAADFRRIAFEDSSLDAALLITATTSMRCTYCLNETFRTGNTRIIDLLYQTKYHNPKIHAKPPSFSDIIKTSFEREMDKRGFCNNCRRYPEMATRAALQYIPPIFFCNAGAERSTASLQCWGTPGWLPTQIGLILQSGSITCIEGDALQNLLKRPHPNLTVYELVGFVADISSSDHQKPHLVSMVNVAVTQKESTNEDNWHLFNDFLVRKIDTEEALRFSPNWKTPSILAYQVTSARHMIDDSWKSHLDTSALYFEWSMNQPAESPNPGHVLDPDNEAPRTGTHVAIDTEFVTVQQEEIEIKADGDRVTTRPKRSSLARVSVLRGEAGPEQGLPFINDYVTTNEPIIDYVTEFSGLREGDLDVKSSRHALVPLKIAYKKLWLLLNLGCVFIGHGLPGDFRTINIHVPSHQVIDTIKLFHMKGQKRKFSLKFLTWFFLKEEGFQKGEHDSIKDAEMALRLWKKWEEFTDAGILENMVEELWAAGRKYGFKPPLSGGVVEGRARLAAVLGDDGVRSRSRTPVRMSTPSGVELSPGKGI